jgi:pyridoxine kinase
MPKFALTIAGSEATGGAGAQADLKTFQQHDVFGMVALTCIVSFDPSNNWGHRFVPVDSQVIDDQIDAVTGAYGRDVLDTVKIGMLGTPDTISVVAQNLRDKAFTNVVLDPVLICKGQEPGAALDTDNALKAEILPLATVVTPNHFESLQLSGMSAIETEDDLIQAAKRIHELFGSTVIAKGGVRIPGVDAIDVFYDGHTLEILRAPKVGEIAVSGAGCTLAAAVTAGLAQGLTELQSARAAKEFVTKAIIERVSSNAPFDAVWQGN